MPGETQQSFDMFLRDGGYDSLPPEERRDPFIQQLAIDVPLPVLIAIEDFGGFNSVKNEKDSADIINHHSQAVLDAEKHLCPQGEYYQKFIPVGAIIGNLGTVVLHRSLSQEENGEIFGDVAYLTRTEQNRKAVGIARFNLSLGENEIVLINTFASKGNPFKREVVQYRGSKEMLGDLSKYIKNPNRTKDLESAYMRLLKARPWR